MLKKQHNRTNLRQICVAFLLWPLEPLAARRCGGPLIVRLDDRELVVARLAEELPLLAVDAEEPAAPGADRLAVVDLLEVAEEAFRALASFGLRR